MQRLTHLQAHRRVHIHRPTISSHHLTLRCISTTLNLTRNPHPDFKKVEASRPTPDRPPFRYTKTVNPQWSFGQGANTPSSTPHIAIDPYAPDRPSSLNYKLLISVIVPRPIAFLSTRSADGHTTNLAPFSYFNMLGHDPPLFVVGFSCSVDNAKDSLRNLLDTKECVINIISDSFVEAANSTSINAPYGSSEWDVSGLTPSYSCEHVKCARVKEAVFSVEARLDFVRESESRIVKGKKTGTMVVLEGLKFWVREDAVNEERSIVDPSVLRPIGRMGGITYSRTNEAFEIPRPKFEEDLGGEEGLDKVRKCRRNA